MKNYVITLILLFSFSTAFSQPRAGHFPGITITKDKKVHMGETHANLYPNGDIENVLIIGKDSTKTFIKRKRVLVCINRTNPEAHFPGAVVQKSGKVIEGEIYCRLKNNGNYKYVVIIPKGQEDPLFFKRGEVKEVFNYNYSQRRPTIPPGSSYNHREERSGVYPPTQTRVVRINTNRNYVSPYFRRGN